MKEMKNGKAPGDDGIPFELLGAGRECIVQQLLKMFNIAYRMNLLLWIGREVSSFLFSRKVIKHHVTTIEA